MISMKTVVKVFVFALFVGIISANLSGQNSESNVLQSQVQAEEQDFVATDEQASYNDFDDAKVSGNSLPDDVFDSIGGDDDDDEDDDF